MCYLFTGVVNFVHKILSDIVVQGSDVSTIIFWVYFGRFHFKEGGLCRRTSHLANCADHIGHTTRTPAIHSKLP